MNSNIITVSPLLTPSLSGHQSLQQTCWLRAAELKRKYGDLEGELLAVSITRPSTRAPLGIVLGGDREQTVQAAYVLALDPKGLVAQKQLMQVGDQILEVRAAAMASFSLTTRPIRYPLMHM